jgi:hypothetical protein
MMYKVGFVKSTSVPDSCMPGLQRVELLCACHASVVALFKAFLAVPETDYQYFSFPNYMQLAQGFIALTFLSKFEHDEWNMSYLPEPLALCDVMSRIVDRFEAAANALGVEHDDNSDEIHIYVLNARKMRGVRDFYRSMILTKTAPDLNLTQQNPDGDTNTEAPAIDKVFDSNDEAWFYDWMGSWDSQDLF